MQNTTKMRTRAELASELGIHPRTLSNYMKSSGIHWGKSLMPPAVWEKVMQEVTQTSDKQDFPQEGIQGALPR